MLVKHGWVHKGNGTNGQSVYHHPEIASAAERIRTSPPHPKNTTWRNHGRYGFRYSQGIGPTGNTSESLGRRLQEIKHEWRNAEVGRNGKKGFD